MEDTEDMEDMFTVDDREKACIVLKVIVKFKLLKIDPYSFKIVSPVMDNILLLMVPI